MPEFDTWFPTTHLPSQGFKIEGTNVDCVGDPTFHSAARIKVTQESGQLEPTFVGSNALSIELTSEANGHNSYRPGDGSTPGLTTQGKHTWTALAVYGVHRGAGQRGLSAFNGTHYGMGDSAIIGFTNKSRGGPVAGDEGQGLALVSYLMQGDYIQLGTVAGTTVRSAINTTATQVIAANKDPQTITVAAPTGAVVGDWMVVEQYAPTGFDVTEAVKITAIGSGTISGIFLNNHPNGVTLKGACCIPIDGAQAFGQQRVLVNMGGASYATGTITGASGGRLTGSGTSWSNTMVGGDALNIGAIAISNDTYNGEFFNGADGGSSGPLRSWHQITTVTDATHLGFHTFSCAGDAGYKGRGNWPSNYIIRPAARMLIYAEGLAICEWSAHAWDDGDLVECAMCPYPDVTGLQFNLAQYTPNATNSRCFMSIANTGATTFQQGIQLTGFMKTTGGGDKVAWDTGIYITGARRAIDINWGGGQDEMECAINLHAVYGGGPVNDNGTKIKFDALGYIMANSVNEGVELMGTGVSSGGKLNFIADHLTTDTPANRPRMDWDGSCRLRGWLDIEDRIALGHPAPSTAAGMARVYCDNNGATPAKARLMVKPPTGAAVQIAIEP